MTGADFSNARQRLTYHLALLALARAPAHALSGLLWQEAQGVHVAWTQQPEVAPV